MNNQLLINILPFLSSLFKIYLLAPTGMCLYDSFSPFEFIFSFRTRRKSTTEVAKCFFFFLRKKDSEGEVLTFDQGLQLVPQSRLKSLVMICGHVCGHQSVSSHLFKIAFVWFFFYKSFFLKHFCFTASNYCTWWHLHSWKVLYKSSCLLHLRKALSYLGCGD